MVPLPPVPHLGGLPVLSDLRLLGGRTPLTRLAAARLVIAVFVAVQRRDSNLDMEPQFLTKRELKCRTGRRWTASSELQSSIQVCTEQDAESPLPTSYSLCPKERNSWMTSVSTGNFCDMSHSPRNDE